MKKDKEPFLIYASPAILAIGIMGFLLYFEVDYLDIGFSALGLWGVVGLWNIERNNCLLYTSDAADEE